jgi:rubrerythrin
MTEADAQPRPRLDELEAKVQEMEERERLKKKYGAVTDEHFRFYKEIEDKAARKAAMVAEMKAKGAVVREQIEKENLQHARDLFLSGHLVVTTNGKRLSKIREDLNFGCPSCGNPLGALFVQAMGNLWKSYPNPMALALGGRSTDNYVVYTGFPIFYEPDMKCPSCQKTACVTIQLVI